jgi:hypothetical protein
MQTLVNATKALKKFQSKEKAVHILQRFCKEEIKILTSRIQNEYQFSTQTIWFQLMKIEVRTRLHRFLQKIPISTKELEKSCWY